MSFIQQGKRKQEKTKRGRRRDALAVIKIERQIIHPGSRLSRLPKTVVDTDGDY